MSKLTKDFHQHAHLPTHEQSHASENKVTTAAKKAQTKAAVSRTALRHAMSALQQKIRMIEETEEGLEPDPSLTRSVDNPPLQGAFRSAHPGRAEPPSPSAHAQLPAATARPHGGRKSALKPPKTHTSAAQGAGTKGRITIDESKNEVRVFTQAPYEMGPADPFNAKLTPAQRAQYGAAVKSGSVLVHEKSKTVVWPDGQMYTGQIVATGPQRGTPNGSGVITLRNGRAYPSIWKDGTCQRLLADTGTDSLEDVISAKTVAQYGLSFMDKLKSKR